MEDYYECLHHKKEVCLSSPVRLQYKGGGKKALLYLRGLSKAGSEYVLTHMLMFCFVGGGVQAAKTRALQQAYRKAEAKLPREDAPRAGAIRNLGLLDKEEDTKAVLGGKWNNGKN